MKLMKSLLLGSAAGFAAVAGAQAADLPSKKAAPVEYVRVCSQFGAGFFYIPGSDTCLKVSGRVRADYIYGETFTRSGSPLTFRARGYLALDSFTATDWGPLRATTRVYITRDSNRGANGQNIPGANIGTGAATTNADIALDWAYIQFAGITAGRVAVSFFEFAPFGGISYLGGGANGRGSDYGSINALAYTATFGGGFSATLALEDGTERRVGIANTGNNFLINGAPSFGGQVMPDLVGRLDYTSTWGQVALTAAVHQTRVGYGNLPAFTNTFGAANTIGDTEYGFAIQGGLKVNLPMLAPGDALFLQAAYADGANSYTGWAGTGAGTLAPVSADVLYDLNGSGHTSKSWSVTGGLLHYWTPTIRQGVFAAYGALDQYGPWYDTAAFSAGTNLIWSPVKNLDIGAEVTYSKLTQTPRNLLPILASDQRDSFAGRIRFERDF
jgi:hypothetical protein